MKVQLVDSVQNAVTYIINTTSYKTPPEIVVSPGSEAGDGYASKTYAISIKSENEKDVNLFVKYFPEDVNNEWKDVLVQAFQGEFKFYAEIYPAFNRLQSQKNIKQPFHNVPKHYSANLKAGSLPPIILENLRSLGYTLRDRKKPVDDHHLKLAIQAFARYHAISYAMKDQDPETFKKISIGVYNPFIENFKKIGLDEIIYQGVNQLLDSLDPIADKKFLDHCKNLCDVLTEHTVNLNQNVDEYAAICQGDCWSNNMMFLYDDTTGLPIDIKLIDWQGQRINSPVLDFAYFFYTIATKEILDNAEYYLNLYYDTLSQRIKELGSDPEKMYTYKVFLDHWKKVSLFGLTMAFCVVKMQLFEPDEIQSFISSADTSVESFAAVLKHQDKYIQRMRDVIEYFIDKKFI